MTTIQWPPDDGSDTSARMRRLRERVAQIEKRLLKLERSVARQTEDLLSDICTVIEELETPLPPVEDDDEASTLPRPDREGRRRGVVRAPGCAGQRIQTDEEKVLREQALRGVGRCDVRSSADGTWWVQVDECEPFTLPPALARLLAVLCHDNGASEDNLVGWKQVADVVRMLRKRQSAEGGAARKLPDPKRDAHSVRQGLHRLRQALVVQNVNHKLVMVSRPLGVRFGLRHSRHQRDGR
jgi:hypothetical protein